MNALESGLVVRSRQAVITNCFLFAFLGFKVVICALWSVTSRQRNEIDHAKPY